MPLTPPHLFKLYQPHSERVGAPQKMPNPQDTLSLSLGSHLEVRLCSYVLPHPGAYGSLFVPMNARVPQRAPSGASAMDPSGHLMQQVTGV